MLYFKWNANTQTRKELLENGKPFEKCKLGVVTFTEITNANYEVGWELHVTVACGLEYSQRSKMEHLDRIH